MGRRLADAWAVPSKVFSAFAMQITIGSLRTRLAAVCIWCLAGYGIPTQAALAETGGHTSIPANASLDLSSRQHTLLVPNSTPVFIHTGGALSRSGTLVGGTRTEIAPGSLLTPAEYLAVTQILDAGRQQLLLTAAGAARGGSVNFSPSNLVDVSSLIIPARVSALSVGFNTTTPLVVTGKTAIAGSLYLLQNAPGLASVFDSGSLFVATHGLLSGSLPTNLGILSGLSSSAGLTINVAQNLVNHGTITSPGALTISTGGDIINQSVGRAPATLSAGSISLFSGSGNFTNSGLIQATTSVDLQTNILQNMLFNNAGGTLRSQQGAINLRDMAASEVSDVTLSGGNVYAQALNVFGRNMSVDVDQLLGTVNMTGSQAHVTADTRNLTLGNMNITGDPTWFNLGGNIILSGDILGAGGDIAIVASGDITDSGAAGSVIQTNGHNILLVAGANLSGTNSQVNGDTTTTVTFSGASSTGGNIDLTQHSLIDSSSNSGAGGNIIIAAFADGGGLKGSIDLGNPTIQSFGKAGAANGDVLIIAGGGVGANAVQNLGTINASGGTSGTGNVQVYGAQPVLSGSMSVLNGTVQAGSGFFETLNTSPALPTSQFQAAKVDLTGGSVTAGGDVTVQGGAGLRTASITATDINLSIIATSSGDRIDTTAGTLTASGNVTINANNNDIKTAGIVGGGTATTISLNTSGTAAIDTSAGSVINDALSSGAGGTVSMTSASSITTAAVSANGVGTGLGGTIDLSSSGNISLGGNLAAKGAGGAGGGNITINTGGAAGANIVSTAAGNTIDASGSGTGNGSGGTVSLTAQNNLGLGNITANGASSGSGGTIDITLITSGQDLNIGGACCSAGNVGTLSVQGSGGAANGTVSVFTAGNISVSTALSAGTISLQSTSATGTISNSATINADSSATFTAPAVAVGAAGVTSGGTITMFTNHLTNNGTISSSGNSAEVLVRATSGSLVLDGSSGIISLTGGGTPTIAIEADAGSLSFNTSASMDAGSAGSIQIIGNNQIALAANVAVNTGSTSATITTPLITFADGSSITSARATGTGISLTAPSGSGIVLQAADNGTAMLSSSGADIDVTGVTVRLSKSTGTNASIFDFNGGTANIQASFGSLTIDPSVIVASNNYLDLNPVNGTLVDNGTVTNSGASGVIEIKGSGVTLGGAPNPITMTGGGTPKIIINGFDGGANLISNYTLNSGSNGEVDVNTWQGILGNGSFSVAAGKTFSVTGGAPLVFAVPVLTVNNGATISVAKSSGTAITISSAFTALTVTPVGSASITTTGGDILVAPPGGGAPINFTSASASTLNFNPSGGTTRITTLNADVSVGSNVTLQSPNDIVVTTTGGSLHNDGVISSTAGSLTVSASTGVTNVTGGGTLGGTQVNVSSDTAVSLTQGAISGALTGTAPNSYVVDITGNGTTMLGNISTTNGNITITGNGGQIEQSSGTMTSANGSVQITNNNLGNIALDAGSLITSAATSPTVNLTADGSIIGGGTVVASAVTLQANNGNIGTGATSRLNTVADTLTLTATKGSAWVNDANAITLNASFAKNQMYVGTLAAGNLTVGGVLTGGDIRLNTFTGGGSNILLNAAVGDGSTTNVTLAADGSVIGSSMVTGTTVNLIATNGNVGSHSSSRTNTAAGTLSVTANATTAGNGNGWVDQTGSGNIGSSSVTNQLLIDTVSAGNLTVTGTVAGSDIRITTLAGAAGNIVVNGTLGTSAATTDVYVTADGSISGTGVTGATAVNLVATTGDIGASGSPAFVDAPNLVANAFGSGHNVYVSDSQTVNISAPSQANGGTFSLQTTGTGNIVQNDTSFTAITANSVQLSTVNGGIGVISTNPFLTDANVLSINTGGTCNDAYVVNSQAVSLDTSNVSGSLRLDAPGTITVVGDVVTGCASGCGSLYLNTTAADGNIQVDSGSSLTSIGGAVVLSTNGSGSIVTNGGDLNIFAATNIDLTGVGGMAIDTTSASGNGGSVTMHAGTSAAGGSILADGFSINTSGTGTNGSAGNVDLSIINGTTANTVDLGSGSITASGVGTAATSTNGNITIASTGTATFGSLVSENTSAGAVTSGGSVQLTVNTSTPASVSLVSIRGGNVGGAGGSLTITQNGTGGVNFDAGTDILASATFGQGGSITVNSPSGITFSGAPTSFNVDTASGSGGSINLNAPGGAININAPAVDLVANSTSGTGGTVALSSADLNYGSASDTFSASVNNSGEVSVTTTDPASDILLGTGGSRVNLVATGANGTVAVTAGGSILNGSGSPVVSASNVVLTALNGNIGVDAGNRLSIDAANLTANASNGSSYIEDTANGVAITGASGANLTNGTFDLLASGGGGIAVSAPITAYRIVLTSTGSGNITQTAPLQTSDLTVGVENGSATLNNATNDVSSLNIGGTGTGSVSYTNSGALTLVSVAGNTLSSVDISAGGVLTASTGITAGSVSLSGTASTGTTALDVAGTINATGTVSLSAVGGGDLSIGSAVNGTNVNLSVSGSGSISQAAPIAGTNLSVSLADGTANLTNPGNNFNNISITDSAGIDTGYVNYFNAGSLTLTAVNGPGTLAGLSITTGGGTFTDNAANVTAGSVTFTANGTANIAINGNISSPTVSLVDNGTGDITQSTSSTMTGTTLSVDLSGGNVNLNSPTNNFSQFNVTDTAPSGTTSGSVSLSNSGSLSVATGGTGTLDNLSITSGGTLTPDNSVTVGGTLTLDTPNLILENPTGTSNNLQGNVILITNSNGSVMISGSSTITSSLLTSIFSATGGITFAPLSPETSSALTFSGPTNITADSTNGSVTVGTGVSLVGNCPVNLTTPDLVMQGTLAGNPFTLHSSTGTGLIANPNGDVRLTANLTFFGKDLAILASGSVIATSGIHSINLSNSKATISKGDGGSLTIIAGYDFALVGSGSSLDSNFKAATLGTYQLLGPSASGGSVYMPRVSINTSSTYLGGDGGSVTIIAHAGDGTGANQNAGTVSLGSINTSGSLKLGGVDSTGKPLGIGGAVTIFGQGGVQTGAITTRGATGGRVNIKAAEPDLVGGPEFVEDGTLIGNGGFVAYPADGKNGGAISIASINTGATKLRGGDVILMADQQIELGSITTTGIIGPIAGVSAGGDVTLNSLLSKIVVRGRINTSATNSSSASPVGNAGDISIRAGSFISLGSMMAKGAQNLGTGNGGNGGDITISTAKDSVVTPSSGTQQWSTGLAKIGGIIDARGGNANRRSGSGNGGNGGNLTIDVGELSLAGSIIVSGGLKGKNGAAGSGGTVDLTTYALQPVASSMDLTSSTRNIPILPGGLFTVGTGSSVNGVSGIITSDSNIANRHTNSNGRVIDTTPVNINGKIKITVVGSTVAFNENSADVSLPFLTVSGARTMVTPAEAVALYQTSRDQTNGTASQSITLMVAPGKVGGAATGGTITFDQADLNGQTFTSVKIPQNVTLDVTGVRPALNIGTSAFSIAGTLNFVTPASMDYVAVEGSPSMSSSGVLATDPTSTLVISATGSRFTNNGQLNVGQLVLARPTTAGITFVTGAGASTQASELLVAPSANIGMSITIQDHGGASFNLPVEFGNVGVPAMYKTNAISAAANAFRYRNVALTFALQDANGSAFAGQVGGSIVANNITIRGAAETINRKTTQTPITIQDNAQLVAQGTSLAIRAAANINIGNSVVLYAGKIKGVDPTASGFLSDADTIWNSSSLLSAKTDMLMRASTLINATSGNVNVGSADEWINNGPSLRVTANSGNITTGDGNTFRDMGGNLVMLAKGTITGATISGNHFQAKGLTTGLSGGIELGSGTTLSSVNAGFYSKRGSVSSIGIGTPITINNDAGHLGVVLVTPRKGTLGTVNLSNSILTFTGITTTSGGGVVVFDVNGGASSVNMQNSTFDTKSSRPVSFDKSASDPSSIIVFTDDDSVVEDEDP